MEMEAKFLYNPKGKGMHCHAPTLLETADGDLLASWYAYDEEEHKNASLILARREKGRADWASSKPVLEAGGYSIGNPVLYQEPDGRIWLLFVLLKGNYWNDAILEGMHSDDGGYSWSQPVQLWSKPGVMVRHPPVPLHNGALMLPVYDETLSQSFLLTSLSPYKKWKATHRFTDVRLIQPALIREGHRRLALLFRPCSDPRRIWRSHSEDDGTTWSVPLRTPLPNPLSGIASFMVNDSIAVVYNHTEKHQRHPLSISLSHDGGTTWNSPWNIDNIQHEVSYPSFLMGQNGIIHGVYTYNRKFIKYVSIHKDQLLKVYEQNR